jgi:hypothetical protein
MTEMRHTPFQQPELGAYEESAQGSNETLGRYRGHAAKISSVASGRVSVVYERQYKTSSRTDARYQRTVFVSKESCSDGGIAFPALACSAASSWGVEAREGPKDADG